MSSSKTPASPATVSSAFDRRSRRDSVTSQPMSPQVDKEQLAMALDKIHTSASQSDVLTTFNDFGPPPMAAAPVAEPKSATGQQGLSGFYSRLKEAVGVGGKATTPEPDEGESQDAGSSSRPSHTRSKSSVTSLPRGDSGATSSTFNSTTYNSTASSSDFPSTSATSASGGVADSYVQVPSSTKAPAVAAISTSMAAAKPASATQTLQKLNRTPASVVVDPANASGAVGIYKDYKESSRSSARSADELASMPTVRRGQSRPNESHHVPNLSTGSSMYDAGVDQRKGNGLADITTAALLSRRDENQALDGSSEALRSPVKGMPPYHAALGSTGPAGSGSRRDDSKKPLVIDRLSIAGTSVGKRSPSVLTETSMAEASPISMSAHGSVYHESFAHDERPEQLQSGKMRIPGTTTSEGSLEMVNARLERMRKQVLSKEFWMADETCKECFLCGDPFSAFRRKHHCRTCGWIFDSKCTSTISGQKFGVPGNLRVCKTCLNVINRRDDSGSDSDDPRLTSLLRSNATRAPSAPITRPKSEDGSGTPDRTDDAGEGRATTTPMMAIPATRRIGDPSNRNSAILEIDAPQLSRPSSSRSLKSMVPARPPSAGHMRHHSKHNFMWNLKPTSEERVPFRKDISDEMARKSKLPAFHDDNIIDPELAPYMSDESSGDEQMSIFSTLASNDLASSLDPDKPNFGPFLSAGRKHRPRGEKSISGLSFTSRGVDDGGGSPSIISHTRTPARRRNMSSASGPASQHHLRSPRTKVGAFKGPALSSETPGIFDATGGLEGIKPTRPASAKSRKSKLSGASMKHTRRLFRQLLDDASIPNSGAWEKALVPLLRKCAEDVDPDTGEGDRMDIRHYVKLKKIPGGKPHDSTYVSGVIFTKNLALKSMPRRISHPRILIISFPIEYQRQQQHQFMSLEPVMSQEKEFLKMVVARIKNHQPEVVLAERNVAGLALQSLAEAGIAVAYNVKASVIGAVSRFVGTPIISSMDMLSLPLVVGRCAEFEVKTFVNNDIPGRKKTYIYLSGCEKYLGSTIALRGTSTEHLRRVKQITEFMVYVVYSLKLESCLLGDGCVKVPTDLDYLHHTLSTVRHPAAGSLQTVDGSAERSPAASTVLVGDTESLQTTHSDESNSKAAGGPSTTGDSQPGTGDSQVLETSHASLQQSTTPSVLSFHDERSRAQSERQMPEDVPAPTFYSDMVEKYKTKILSSSPFVKFTQPYLLMKAREQETRLLYLKRLRDQDMNEEERDESGAENKRQQFQLINPEMVHEIGQKAPRQVMEVLHAVHDAEYDKALYAYQTHMRQWENYIQGNLNLFDPYSHQNIVVLYSVTCTETKIPCLEPGLIGISYYNELPDPAGPMDADCTLGQYVQDLCDSAEERCNANGCDRPMWQHHRTYVHGEARVTIFVEPEAKLPSNPEPLYEGYEDDEDDEDTIYMWSYCKICKRDLTVKRLSQSAWKYSFGKYLELLFWAQGLRMSEDTGCTHDCQTEHIRYFHIGGASVRIHYDPIDLLEVVVPRTRLTWKVDHDLKLKNEIFLRMQDRWNRFITSVKSRIKSIRIDSVLPDKAESCKAEVDRLAKKAQEEHSQLIRQLQRAYMQSKHYEIIPLNAAIRSMVEKIAEWDAAFAKFEADFLSDKDVRQLTVIQLRKMFTDNESKESLPATDTTSVASLPSEAEVKTPTSTVPATSQGSVVGDVDEKQTSTETSQQSNETELQPAEAPAAEPAKDEKEKEKEPQKEEKAADKQEGQGIELAEVQTAAEQPAEAALERADPLDLAAAKLPEATVPESEAVPPPNPESQQSTASTQTTTSSVPATPALPAAPPATPAVPTGPAPSMLPVPVGSGPPMSPTRPVRAGTSSSLTTQQTLSEKVEQLRREFQAHSTEVNQAAQTLGGGSSTGGDSQSQSSRPDRPARKSGLNVSPPIVRSTTQPVMQVPRTLPGPSKQALAKDVKTPPAEMTLSGSTELHKTSSEVSQPKLEKKFSERIPGLSALNKHRKAAGPSGIPRFVHKKKESKVTSLARHFEQLSREFEKERNRERRQRAAKMHHPRAYFPKSSARAIVEVYDDVDQAVQEPGPIDDTGEGVPRTPTTVISGMIPPGAAELGTVPGARDTIGGAGPSTGAGRLVDEVIPEGTATGTDGSAGKEGEAPPLSSDPPSQQPSEESAETATEADAEDHEHKHESTVGSEDEAGSDADQSLEDILPDVETIAEHLEPSGTVPAELQKDKKSNLMKMLSNFWAERSASGWPQLDYPINPTDHIFIDSDVIVREDEPSSLIAFALSSEDYIAKLRDIRRQGRRASRRQKQEKAKEARGEVSTSENEPDEDDGEEADDEEEEELRRGAVGGFDKDEAGERMVGGSGKRNAGAVAAGDGSGQQETDFDSDFENNNNNGNGNGTDNDLEDFDAGQVGEDEEDKEALPRTPPRSLDGRSAEDELEKSLLRPTGTHLKYQFTEGSARMMCKIFYAEQFDALRRKCGVADRIIESLSRCLKWDSKGGKTKSVFLKTLDDRFVMKALSPVETAAFLGFAPSYFSIMAEALFHDLPSVIAKMLGFFQVIVKNAATGTEIKLDLLIMENLFYDRQETRKFDLKGSMRNRKIQSTGEQNEVLLDENMVEYIYESPLFAREHAKKLLRASVWNDTLFLARQNVMDYSLMVAVDESRKELVVGIIDCIRTYTWDKKLESWIKDRGFAGGGRNRPTVTSPKEYKSRFREAMERYILQAPNCWHLFGNMQYSHPALAPRARFEADE